MTHNKLLVRFSRSKTADFTRWCGANGVSRSIYIADHSHRFCVVFEQSPFDLIHVKMAWGDHVVDTGEEDAHRALLKIKAVVMKTHECADSWEDWFDFTMRHAALCPVSGLPDVRQPWWKWDVEPWKT